MIETAMLMIGFAALVWLTAWAWTMRDRTGRG
jgi:hypothetical protein